MSKKKIKTEQVPARKVKKPGSNNLLIRLILVFAVLILYGNSTGFEFTLDDDLFFLKHESVQKGVSAISEFFTYGSLNKFDGTTGIQPYRPVTLLFFAIEKDLFDNDSAMLHLTNVLLYILVLQLLFTLLRRLFPSLHPMVAGLITLLFAVHPIHTEVVSSVKSLDEILAAIFGFAAWIFFIPKTNDTKIMSGSVLLGTFFFFLSLLSKESAIVFLILIPLSQYMILKKDLKFSALQFIPLMIMSIFFLFIRYKVLGTEGASFRTTKLENVLYGANNLFELTATKAQILFYYIKLLFVPWPLNWDYSYNQVPVVNWSSLVSWAGLIIYATLFIFAIINFRKKPVFSFCIFFFFIASSPTNNLLLINGATIGERFLFVPSLAYAIAIVYLLGELLKVDLSAFSGKKKNMFTWILSSLILLFSGLTFARSAEWKSNLTLFEKGVERSPNSSRAQYSVATEYLNYAQKLTDTIERNRYLQKAKGHFLNSIGILPENSKAHYNGAICYSLLGDTANAILHYEKYIDMDTSCELAINNLGAIFESEKAYDSARYYYEKFYKMKPASPVAPKKIGELLFRRAVSLSGKGNISGALEAYKEGLFYLPADPMAYNNIGVIYVNAQNYDSAVYYYKKGLEFDSGNIMLIENIAAISLKYKHYDQAIQYANRALTISKNSKKSFGILSDSYMALGNKTEAAKYDQLYKQAN